MKHEINLAYISSLSVVAAIGGFLFGYDTAVISGTIAQVSTQFHLNPVMQGWYVGCALIGSIGGVLAGGIISDRFGRKRTLFVAAILFSISALACAVSTGFHELVTARIVGGIGIGIVSIISPLYISELSVANYRGRLVSLYQLAVTVGFLGAYLINFFLLNFSNNGASSLNPGWLRIIFHDEVWRSMLGMAVVPSIIFFIMLFFIPESPRWLVLRGKDRPAIYILEKIYKLPKRAAKEFHQIKDVSKTATGFDWKQLKEKGLGKAVLIGVAIAILGQFMGVNAVLYYGPAIFERSGLSGNDSLFYQVIVGLVNVLTTVLAFFVIDKVGRKKLVYFGVSGMVLTLMLIAVYFVLGSDIGLSALFLLGCFLCYVFCCAISISAVIWVLLSEMYPGKIRGMAMSIAGLSLWVGTYLIGQLTPWFLETLTPGGTFLFFALMCIPYLLIVWKLVPETTGKSLEDIERHWIH
uniref:Sugar transporter n=1 Tax=Sphingobacterium sp. (strain 21) TaxID=743722 RepID=F4CEK4_SPHS2